MRALLLLLAILATSCRSEDPLFQFGADYQATGNSFSLQKVVDLLPTTADTTLVRRVLGEKGIDMGFDLRYLLDSVGPNNCVVGAVFHYDDQGLIDQKWIGEICE